LTKTIRAGHYSRLAAPAGTSKGFPKEALEVSPKLSGLSSLINAVSCARRFSGFDFFGSGGRAAFGAWHRGKRVFWRELMPHRAASCRQPARNTQQCLDQSIKVDRLVPEPMTWFPATD
jgi:hypothetical protein